MDAFNFPWHPTRTTRIFRFDDPPVQLTPHQLDQFSFLKCEALLFNGDWLKHGPPDAMVALGKILRSRGIQPVLSVAGKEAALSKLPEWAEQSGLALNLRVESPAELSGLSIGPSVAWITSVLDGTSKVADWSELLESWAACPIFFEFGKRLERAGLQETLDFCRMNFQFIHAFGDLPYIYSLENPDARFPRISLSATDECILTDPAPVVPDLSIVIPCFNRSRYLPTVLQSLARQSDVDLSFEVLILDDGSSDFTLDRLTAWTREINPAFPLRYIYVERPATHHRDFINRVGPIRNLGAQRALGPYLLFLDSDILLPPDFLTRRRLEELRGVVLQPFRQNLSRPETDQCLENPLVHPAIPAPPRMGAERAEFLLNNIPDSDFVQWCASYCWLMKKSDFMEIGGFRNSFITYGWEDLDFVFRLRKRGLRIVPIGETVLHLNTLADSSEYSDDGLNRRIKLAPGAELFFRNTLSVRALNCFVFGLLRAVTIHERYFELSGLTKRDSFLDEAELDRVISLGKSVLPAVRYEDVFASPASVATEDELLAVLRANAVPCRNVLILGGALNRLPTRLLLDPSLGVGSVRRVLKDTNAYETDNFLNFPFLIGWKFKSGRAADFRVWRSEIELWLVNDLGETVRSPFLFDTIVLEDATLIESIQEFTLKPDTRIVISADHEAEGSLINILTGIKVTFERIHVGRTRSYFLGHQKID